MGKRPSHRVPDPRRLEKAPTGIDGFDEVTLGGLPRGRTALVCGAAGCGKTLFAMQFLVKGAVDYGEPGVFMAFEETPEDLARNFESLGFHVDDLVARGLVAIDHVQLDPNDILESGEYDLEGLFLRLDLAIQSTGAKRVVIDTLENLFGGLKDHGILRSELGRLFRWLKDKGITAVITAERGEGVLTRHGLEEYVSDCVILLEHRVSEQITTRTLRVVKYRGSAHGSNEYPFLIDETGIRVTPITSAGLDHDVSDDRVSSGVPQLDEMLGARGYYRGSTILVSGTAGTGKTSLSAHFVDAACRRGERCLFSTSEESPRQIVRNMRSIGIDLGRWQDKGLLRFMASRPTTHGLEMHLSLLHKALEDYQPAAVILDPVSNFTGAGDHLNTHLTLVRIVDALKSRGTTAVLTSLSNGGDTIERTDVGISSIVDTWLLVKFIESQGERNRGLYVLKSRGMAHSNQIREFLLTANGIELVQVYAGLDGVLTGSARVAREAREKSEELKRKQEMERRRTELDHRRKLVEGQIAQLRAELEAHEREALEAAEQSETAARERHRERAMMAQRRGGETFPSETPSRVKRG